MSDAAPLPVTHLPLIVSIQSQVAFGHVGNSAAAYPMRACGAEVIEIPTALLSNHPHYPTMHGQILDPVLVEGLLTGLGERGLHGRIAVILSGFMGDAGTAQAVAAFVRRAKADNPHILYVCDPVMGDADLGYFVPEAIRDAFSKHLVPLADVIVPNAFELETLSGMAVEDAAGVARAREALGVPAVVATSVPVAGHPDRLATVTVSTEGSSTVEVAKLAARPAGTGDLLAGLTAARLALGVPLPEAVARAVAGVAEALTMTSTEPWSEMPIEAAIKAIIGAEIGTGAATVPA